MGRLKLTGLDLGRVFNSRSSCLHAMHLRHSIAKQASLELKTRSEQLSSLLLAFVHPGVML